MRSGRRRAGTGAPSPPCHRPSWPLYAPSRAARELPRRDRGLRPVQPMAPPPAPPLMSSNERKPKEIVQHEGDGRVRPSPVRQVSSTTIMAEATASAKQELALPGSGSDGAAAPSASVADTAFSRVLRARSMSRHTWAITVVSQPLRLSIAPASARVTFSHASPARRLQASRSSTPAHAVMLATALQAGPVPLASSNRRAQGCASGHIRLQRCSSWGRTAPPVVGHCDTHLGPRTSAGSAAAPRDRERAGRNGRDDTKFLARAAGSRSPVTSRVAGGLRSGGGTCHARARGHD